MGIAAEVKLFRYRYRPASGGVAVLGCFVLANVHTSTLIISGQNNLEPIELPAADTSRMILPLVSRGGSIHPAARVAVIQFTAELPPGLVTRRQSICVLTTFRFDSWSEGMTGTFRGLPVRLVKKIDGRPDTFGRF